MVDGVRAYAGEVRARRFPDAEHVYSVDPAEIEELERRWSTGVVDLGVGLVIPRGWPRLAGASRGRAAGSRLLRCRRASAHRRVSSRHPRRCRGRDITGRVQGVVDARVPSALAAAFVRGSTAAITTMEYEPGGVRDLQELLDRLIPARRRLRAQPAQSRHQLPRPPAGLARGPVRGRPGGGRTAGPRHVAAARPDRLRRPRPPANGRRAGCELMAAAEPGPHPFTAGGHAPERAYGPTGTLAPRAFTRYCPASNSRPTLAVLPS